MAQAIAKTLFPQGLHDAAPRLGVLRLSAHAESSAWLCNTLALQQVPRHPCQPVGLPLVCVGISMHTSLTASVTSNLSADNKWTGSGSVPRGLLLALAGLTPPARLYDDGLAQTLRAALHALIFPRGISAHTTTSSAGPSQIATCTCNCGAPPRSALKPRKRAAVGSGGNRAEFQAVVWAAKSPRPPRLVITDSGG